MNNKCTGNSCSSCKKDILFGSAYLYCFKCSLYVCIGCLPYMHQCKDERENNLKYVQSLISDVNEKVKSIQKNMADLLPLLTKIKEIT